MARYGKYGREAQKIYDHGYIEGKAVGLEEGRRKGQESVRKDLLSDGVGVAFNKELAKVKKESFDRGYNAGRNEKDSIVQGRKEWRREGIVQGHKEGRQEGIAQGRKEGRREGIAQGHKEWRREGRVQGVLWTVVGGVLIFGGCLIFGLTALAK